MARPASNEPKTRLNLELTERVRERLDRLRVLSYDGTCCAFWLAFGCEGTPVPLDPVECFKACANAEVECFIECTAACSPELVEVPDLGACVPP